MENKNNLEKILIFNKEFVEAKEYEKYQTTKYPEKKNSNSILYGHKINRTSA